MHEDAGIALERGSLALGLRGLFEVVDPLNDKVSTVRVRLRVSWATMR